MTAEYGMPAAKVLAAMDKMRETELGQKYMATHAPNDPAFAVWLMIVDRDLQKQVQVGHRDLSDWGWRDAYDNGTSPKDAAQQALADDDLFGAVFADGE
jgi:hypothetical protein